MSAFLHADVSMGDYTALLLGSRIPPTVVARTFAPLARSPVRACARRAEHDLSYTLVPIHG